MKRWTTMMMAGLVLAGVAAQAQDRGRGDGPRRAMSRQERMRRPPRATEEASPPMAQAIRRRIQGLEEENRDLEARNDRLSHRLKRLAGPRKAMRCLFAICLLVHLLATIWVYQDQQRRKKPSGLWLVLVLLAGLPAAAVYALVRIGDAKE